MLGQGCERLLVDGVFDTFNRSTTNESFDSWHQWWCNGSVEETKDANSSSGALNVVIKKIPLGISFQTARDFQRSYQQTFCGQVDFKSVHLDKEAVMSRVASRDLIEAYVACKKVEDRGISAEFISGDRNTSFVLNMRYNKPFEGGRNPLVTSVIFIPRGSVSCEGEIKPNTALSADNKVLACERKTDKPIQVVVNSQAGSFTRTLPSVNPPPSDTDRVLKAMPSGTILAWSAKTQIPTGWRLCDGQAGTPDLRDRYPVGTALASEVGKQLGTADHNHTYSGQTDLGRDRGFIAGGLQFERQGGHTANQDYGYSGTTSPSPNVPLSTKIQYIMKL